MHGIFCAENLFNKNKNIRKLKEYGILVRHGSPRNGYWEITQKYE